MRGLSRHFRKTALFTVLAATLIQGATASTVTPTATPSAAADPNLSIEQQFLERYFNDLRAYDRGCSQVAGKAQVHASDIDPLQRKSDDLRQRLSDVQRTIGEVIRKLKAANAWDDLDQKVLARLTDPRQRALFQPSGLKAALEEASTSLGSRGNEISTPLETLRKKVTSQLIDGTGSVVLVGYSSPRPNPLTSPSRLRCLGGKIRLGLIHRLGGTPTTNTFDEVCCACNCGAIGNTGISGTPCSQVQ